MLIVKLRCARPESGGAESKGGGGDSIRHMSTKDGDDEVCVKRRVTVVSVEACSSDRKIPERVDDVAYTYHGGKASPNNPPGRIVGVSAALEDLLLMNSCHSRG